MTRQGKKKREHLYKTIKSFIYFNVVIRPKLALIKIYGDCVILDCMTMEKKKREFFHTKTNSTSLD